jgi:hypothetical protein
MRRISSLNQIMNNFIAHTKHSSRPTTGRGKGRVGRRIEMALAVWKLGRRRRVDEKISRDNEYQGLCIYYNSQTVPYSSLYHLSMSECTKCSMLLKMTKAPTRIYTE